MKPNANTANAYAMSQRAIADLKAAVYQVLLEAGTDGLRNVDIGKGLGIYTGHVEHVGHISRTLLGLMEAEGVVEQDSEKVWRLAKQTDEYS